MDQKTTILDHLTYQQMIDTVIREAAKASKEIATAEADISKANRRIKFCLLLANRLKERTD